MVIEHGLTLSNEHILQYTDYVSENWTHETHIVLRTNGTSIYLIFKIFLKNQNGFKF